MFDSEGEEVLGAQVSAGLRAEVGVVSGRGCCARHGGLREGPLPVVS